MKQRIIKLTTSIEGVEEESETAEDEKGSGLIRLEEFDKAFSEEMLLNRADRQVTEARERKKNGGVSFTSKYDCHDHECGWMLFEERSLFEQ